jgi:hypothetical protein
MVHVTNKVEVKESDVDLYLKCELPVEIKLIYRGVILTCFYIIYNKIPEIHELFGIKSMVQPKSKATSTKSR